MQKQNYTTILTVDQSPAQVFEAILDVKAWWSQDFQGKSKNLHDEFSVRFADVHYSKQKLVELIPAAKAVWQVTECKLNFLKDKNEWTGTKMSFEISEANGKTTLKFTHIGLVPDVECYRDCTNGWNHFLHGSLYSLITSGTGNPNVLDDQISAKSGVVAS